MELQAQGDEYDILSRAARRVSFLSNAMTCEIGLRLGGGSKAIIDGLKSSRAFQPNQVHIAIDPYGQMPYAAEDGPTHLGKDFSNGMRDGTIALLHSYACTSGVNFIFMNMTDEQFFHRYHDGVPTYSMGEERILTKYSLVFMDGVHTLQSVWSATMWFMDRMLLGAIMVYDDVVGWYEHSFVEWYLLKSGWRVYEKGTQKIAYIKEKS